MPLEWLKLVDIVADLERLILELELIPLETGQLFLVARRNLLDDILSVLQVCLGSLIILVVVHHTLKSLETDRLGESFSVKFILLMSALVESHKLEMKTTEVIDV